MASIPSFFNTATEPFDEAILNLSLYVLRILVAQLPLTFIRKKLNQLSIYDRYVPGFMAVMVIGGVSCQKESKLCL
ncbi:MAG: hypothetical protein CL912_13895 [Deltaproteobacteria bacterium]|nr:hypothetical protein [Deltaproteobacteria bacterium]